MITYTDIPRAVNSGGFWYPVTPEKVEGLLSRFAAAFGHELRLPPVPHPYTPGHAYYYLGGWRCQISSPDDDYCGVNPHFRVRYDSLHNAVEISYHLGHVLSVDQYSDLLSTFADETGFDVKHKIHDSVSTTFHASDGGISIAVEEERGWPSVVGSQILIIVRVGGWSNKPLPESQLLSDDELHAIAKEFTTRNMDIIDPDKCRDFKQIDPDGKDQSKYVHDGVPVLRLPVAVIAYVRDTANASVIAGASDTMTSYIPAIAA